MRTPRTEASGPVYLVTGAGGRGIGRGIADHLASRGARLVLNDIDAAGVDALRAAHPTAEVVRADITDPAAAESLIDAAYAAHDRLDGIVNNAGRGHSVRADLSAEADFDDLFALNLRAAWLLSRAYARRQRADARASGAIVNISSVHARSTQSGYALYAATKAGLEGLTRGMAIELGPFGIRCNAVAPGLVFDTRPPTEPWMAAWVDRHAARHQVLDRAMHPRDIGGVVGFLLSPDSWPIVGQTVVADAGLAVRLYDRETANEAVPPSDEPYRLV